jgi:hypothetical protein
MPYYAVRRRHVFKFPKTKFSDKCNILTEIWLLEESELSDYYKEWEISFGLAYAHTNKYAKPTQAGKKLIDNLWEHTLNLSLISDSGFKSLEELNNAIKLSSKEEFAAAKKADEDFEEHFLAGLRGETL